MLLHLQSTSAKKPKSKIGFRNGNIKTHNISPFYSEVVDSWNEINIKTDETYIDILSQGLWYNNFLKIDGKPIIFQDYLDKGIILINDLIKRDGDFKTLRELVNEFNISKK